MKLLFVAFLLIFHSTPVFSAEGFTGGKGFWPWIWQDQLKPTAQAAVSREQGYILGVGSLATILSHQYDGEVREQFGANRRLNSSVTRFGSIMGGGAPAVLIALTQLAFDRENGLRLTRTLAFTATTHITIAGLVQRERPNGNKLSFPSGHTSSAFAAATSLAYAYGPYVGVPALAIATFTGASRIADDAHWISDTVAGAALGIFWARASVMADRSDSKKSTSMWMPVLVPGGATVAYSADF